MLLSSHHKSAASRASYLTGYWESVVASIVMFCKSLSSDSISSIHLKVTEWNHSAPPLMTINIARTASLRAHFNHLKSHEVNPTTAALHCLEKPIDSSIQGILFNK